MLNLRFKRGKNIMMLGWSSPLTASGYNEVVEVVFKRILTILVDGLHHGDIVLRLYPTVD